MKKQRLIPYAFAIALITLAVSCTKDDEQDEPLKADAGPDITVAPLDTAWLDHTASTGNYTSFEWQLNNNASASYHSSKKLFYFVPAVVGSFQATLRITSGNTFSEDQTSIDVTGSIVLSGTISQNRTLTSTNQDVDYVVNDDLIVAQDVILTINENVNIAIAQGKGIIVNGRIVAKNATFKPVSTSWKGIHLTSSSSSNSFESCVITKAGDASFTSSESQRAAIFIEGYTTIKSCQFIENSGYGFFQESGLINISDFEYNNFTSNQLGPFVADYPILEKLLYQNFSQQAPDGEIRIRKSGTISQSMSIYNTPCPIVVEGLLRFDQFLNVARGVEMKFGSSAGLYCPSGLNIGSVSAGGETGPVILSGETSNEQPSWLGVFSNSDAVISNTIISNAGIDIFPNTSYKAGLIVNGSLHMTQSTIENCGGKGLVMIDGNFTHNSSNNSFINNREGAALVGHDNVKTLVAEGSSFVAFASDFPLVTVRMGSTAGWGLWRDLGSDYDYLITDNLTVLDQEIWVVDPSTTIKFKENTRLFVYGSWTALGTSGSGYIYLTGESNVPGFWGGVIIENNKPVDLNHVRIEYGGSTYPYFCLHIGSSASSVNATNSFFINSSGYGVWSDNAVSGAAIQAPEANNVFGGEIAGFGGQQ